MRVSILTLGSVLTLASCTPVPDFVVHEKRGNLDSRWIASEVKLDRRTIIPVAIGLTQQNLHNGEEYLMDISDPTSPNYGKHWSAEKVDLFPFSDWQSSLSVIFRSLKFLLLLRKPLMLSTHGLRVPG
jgi:hypothetical protein